MRKLTAGDMAGRLARIDEAKGRSRKYRRRARKHLLAGQGAREHGSGGYLMANGETICNKRRHATLEVAQRELAGAMQSDLEHRQESRVYHCLRCNGWHLTSKAFIPIEDRQYGYHKAGQQESEAGQQEPGRTQARVYRGGRSEFPHTFVINIGDAIQEHTVRLEREYGASTLNG